MGFDYYIIDAFSKQRFQGAPIAVFPEADALTDEQMQMIASELNQQETVFIFPGDAIHKYGIRIFSTVEEIKFGSHPVVAACYALYRSKKLSIGQYKLKLSIGTVCVDIGVDEKIQLNISNEASLDDFVPSTRELGEILHLDENEIDQSKYKVMISSCGESYLIIPVKSIAQINKAQFNEEKWTMSFVATLAKQILLFCENKSDPHIDYNARLFGKGIAVNEDPPIGSSMPAFGYYVFIDTEDGLHVANVQRGDESRRISKIEVEVQKNMGAASIIKVGGYAVQTGEGVIHLD